MGTITKEDYIDSEAHFFQELKNQFDTNLTFYCVTGSLARGAIEPGWSDIDVIVGVHSYSPAAYTWLGEAFTGKYGGIKIGTNLYSTKELNEFFLFLDTGSLLAIRGIQDGVYTPKIWHKSIIFPKVTDALIRQFERVNITRVLYDLKRQLSIFSPDKEPMIYRHITIILRVLLNELGVTATTYKETVELSKERLELDIDLKLPAEILSKPDQVIQRYQSYMDFPYWLQKYRNKSKSKIEINNPQPDTRISIFDEDINT